MANRNYPQSRLFTNHLLPVQLDVQVAIGSSGAPTIVSGTGKGIAGITRLTNGTYRIQLQDNYASLLALDATFEAPVTGGAVNMGSLATGTVYQIVTLGTSTQAQFVTAGVPAGITAAPGVIFKAAGAGAGNGTVKILGSSGITHVQIAGNPQLMLSNQPSVALLGGYLNILTMGTTITAGAYTPAGTISQGNIPVAAGTAGDAVTNNAGVLNSTGGQDLTVDAQTFTGSAASLTATATSAPVDPTSGSTMILRILLNNSQVQ